MNPLDELATILRPAGGGIFLFSTGKAQQLALQQRLYGVSSEAEVQQKFRERLELIPKARGVLLGIPSDVGAGFRRGSNLGPQAVRLALLERGTLHAGLLDLGDVFAVPQLLHDDMLSKSQIDAARAAIYPGVSEALPVSPLSIAERAWELIFGLNPNVKPFALGGDHSTALPGVMALAKRRVIGVVQPDAHTDLLERRLGIKYCFATWSWHANEAIGRKQRLVQVGIRASGKSREHWESTCDVRQFWAADILRDPGAAIDQVVEHVKSLGVTGVYFSNDVDGTDEAFADATGTPEPNGLTPEWVLELIGRLGPQIAGGDVMEVAPVITPKADSAERTVTLAARYFEATVMAALG
ncbi:MAG: arginase family protein [Archangiaceae bacterium]|nr:arginase family protein [Archangiaceae bacterium]